MMKPSVQVLFVAACLVAGCASAGLVEGPKWSFVCGGETFQEGAQLPERLNLRVDATASRDPELPIEEWTFSLTGVGTNDTPRLSRISSADFTLPFASDDAVVLWHGIGETEPNATAKDNYSFRRTPLTAGAAPLRSVSSRVRAIPAVTPFRTSASIRRRRCVA